MSRLNKERQEQLEPKRMQVAKDAINKLGLTITFSDETTLRFLYKESTITYYPYSGWATGKTIRDGRGLQNLLKQLK